MVTDMVYLLGLGVAMVVRTVYGIRYRQRGGDPAISETPATQFFMLLWGLALLLPMLEIFSPWLRFADYHLPTWVGWSGVILFVGANLLLWRSHADLDASFSPELEVLPGQRLVTTGVYNAVRHPMYAAHVLWGLSQPLLIQNWIAGPLALVASVGIYLTRIDREEQMMLDHFGEVYRRYRDRTGGLLPKPRRRESE